MVMIQMHRQGGLDLLHRRYAKLLRVMSMKVLHNVADTDDLVQDVFLEIWNRAMAYNPLMGHPISWIITIARRRSIDRLRKRQTRTIGEERFAQDAQRAGESWTHVHEDLLQTERKKYLERALATLPQEQRTRYTSPTTAGCPKGRSGHTPDFRWEPSRRD